MALPRRTTGSLSPIFILARPVCLAIKLSFAFTLYVRFPTVLREPLSASVTFWGDRPSQTAHLTVSQDQIHGLWLEPQYYKGGIPRMAPPNWRPGFKASHLSCTCSTKTQCQATVKLHGVFPSCRRYPASSPELQFHRVCC